MQLLNPLHGALGQRVEHRARADPRIALRHRDAARLDADDFAALDALEEKPGDGEERNTMAGWLRERDPDCY